MYICYIYYHIIWSNIWTVDRFWEELGNTLLPRNISVCAGLWSCMNQWICMGLYECYMCVPILEKRISCIHKILKESYQRTVFLYFMTLCMFTIINTSWDKMIFAKCMPCWLMVPFHTLIFQHIKLALIVHLWKYCLK